MAHSSNPNPRIARAPAPSDDEEDDDDSSVDLEHMRMRVQQLRNHHVISVPPPDDNNSDDLLDELTPSEVMMIAEDTQQGIGLPNYRHELDPPRQDTLTLPPDANNNNDNPPNEDDGPEDEEVAKGIILSPNYRVLRLGRVLRRAEVVGFCFICLVLACVALQAVVGLQAVGFFPSEEEEVSAEEGDGHIPHSFSWKILSEFYISDALSLLDKECLFLNSQGRTGYRMKGRWQHESMDEDVAATEYLEKATGTKMTNVTEKIPPPKGHSVACPRNRIPDGWNWFYRNVITMSLVILNMACAGILLTFIRTRRRRGLQFTLMLPAFLSVFVGIFQQIPMIFNYSYVSVFLSDEMNHAAAVTSVRRISPIWEETQWHGRCCGVHSSETWVLEAGGPNEYPISCCNRSASLCEEAYPRKDQVWGVGCFRQEYERIRHYEFYTMLLLVVKLLSEMGILWALSDLTRYEYPAPEMQLNSSVTVGDFEVKGKGVAVIQGVSDYRRQVVVKLRKWRPGKYVFRGPHQSGPNTKTLAIRKTMDHGPMGAGSLDIVRHGGGHRAGALDGVVVDVERGRRRGLIFVSFGV